jgi:hypothetical protein
MHDRGIPFHLGQDPEQWLLYLSQPVISPVRTQFDLRQLTTLVVCNLLDGRSDIWLDICVSEMPGCAAN